MDHKNSSGLSFDNVHPRRSMRIGKKRSPGIIIPLPVETLAMPALVPKPHRVPVLPTAEHEPIARQRRTRAQQASYLIWRTLSKQCKPLCMGWEKPSAELWELQLLTRFLNAMKENRLFDILDARVINDGGKEEIIAVANMAKRCLNLNGKKRPTVREVGVELLGIRASNGAFVSQQNDEEIDPVDDNVNEYFDLGTSSSRSLLNSGTEAINIERRLSTN